MPGGSLIHAESSRQLAGQLYWPEPLFKLDKKFTCIYNGILFGILPRVIHANGHMVSDK